MRFLLPLAFLSILVLLNFLASAYFILDFLRSFFLNSEFNGIDNVFQERSFHLLDLVIVLSTPEYLIILAFNIEISALLTIFTFFIIFTFFLVNPA
jgi:hypothetical protein